MLSGSQEGIIEKLKERKRDNPSSIVPCLALAEMYRQMDQYEERRQALFAATRIQSKDLGLMHEIARIEEQEGDWEQALETLTRALPLDDTQKTRQKMARIHIQYGDEEAGYRLLFGLTGGEEMTARDAEAIADAMASGRNWALVIDFLEGILSQHPLDYKLHYLHAVALEEDGRDEDALDAFLALLSMTEEIPGNTEKRIPSPWARQGLSLAEWVPPGALALMEIHSRSRHAYQYRPRRGITGRARSTPSGRGRRVALPPTIVDLPGFSVAHILALSSLFDDVEQNRIGSRMKTAGVPAAKLLVGMSSTGPLNLYQSMDLLVDQHPRDESIQAMWMLNRLGNPRSDQVRYRRVHEMFADDWPRLAYLAGLHYAASGGSDQTITNRSLQILARIPNPSTHEMVGLTSLLLKSGVEQGLSPRVRSLLVRKLVTWYPKIKSSSNSRQQMFGRIATALAHEENLTGFVRFLDDRVRDEKTQSRPTGTTVSRGRPTESALIKPLPYPPRQLPDFPASVFQLIDPSQRNPRVSNRERYTPRPNRLRKYIQVAQDLTLKIVMYLAVGDQNDARRRIEVLMSADPPGLTAYVLAASLATHEEKPLEAIALLERARALPMDSKWRQVIDGAVVAAALELDPNANAVHVDAGRKAALRLRRSAMSPGHRTELVEALEGLGQFEEAAVLARQASPSVTARPRSTRIVRLNTPRTSPQRIGALFDKGKRDAALRLMLTDLRNLALQGLYPQQHPFMRQFHRDAERFAALLNAQGAKEALLALADPGETHSIRKLNQFARICEILGAPNRARQTYEKVLSKRPRDVSARVHLALLLAAQDPQAGAAQLDLLDRRNRD
ncbi:MAG: hypothetical protein IIA65_09550, partial [Planctomycetes bacterium]|nr:hypothetical protein [Planctomycetota bacterium]